MQGSIGRILTAICASAGWALLAGCGGGGDSMSARNPAPTEGTLLQSPPPLASNLSAADLLATLTGTASSPQLQELLTLSGAPICDIAVYHIEYHTLGGKGESTTASGALMVPHGPSQCTGPRPTKASTSLI